MICLGDIATVRAGYSFRTKLEPAVDGDTLVLQMKDISPSGEIDMRGVTRIRLGEVAAHQLQKGDLIVKARGNLNTAGIVSGLPKATLIPASPLLVVRVKDDKILPQYLQWYLNNPVTQSKLTATATGSYVPTVSKQSLEEMEINLLPLADQELIIRIAELAAKELLLRTAIARMRKDAADRILMSFSKKSAGDVRKKGGRRGVVAPRLPDHEQS